MNTRNWALPTALPLLAALTLLSLYTLGADSSSATSPSDVPALPPPSNGAISPQNQADALHYVLAVDREMYCRAYGAQRSAETPSLPAAAGAKPVESWPVPCELVRRAAESIQTKGAEFSYALRSLHPLDPRNEPQTDLEQRGLAFIAAHPDQNFYEQETLGGRRYFTAVYPDLPATAACIDCHQRRQGASSQRHQVGEILGGLVVRVPLEF